MTGGQGDIVYTSAGTYWESSPIDSNWAPFPHQVTLTFYVSSFFPDCEADFAPLIYVSPDQNTRGGRRREPGEHRGQLRRDRAFGARNADRLQQQLRRRFHPRGRHLPSAQHRRRLRGDRRRRRRLGVAPAALAGARARLLRAPRGFEIAPGSLETASGTFDPPRASLETALGTFDPPRASLETASGTFDPPRASRQAASGSFDCPRASLETASGSVNHARASLEIAPGSFDCPRTSLETASGSFDHARASLEIAPGSLDCPRASLETASGSFDYARASLEIAPGASIAHERASKPRREASNARGRKPRARRKGPGRLGGGEISLDVNPSRPPDSPCPLFAREMRPARRLRPRTLDDLNPLRGASVAEREASDRRARRSVTRGFRSRSTPASSQKGPPRPPRRVAWVTIDPASNARNRRRAPKTPSSLRVAVDPCDIGSLHDRPQIQPDHRVARRPQ